MKTKCGVIKRNGKCCTAKGIVGGRCKRHTPEKTGEKDVLTASRVPLKEVKKRKTKPIVDEAYAPSVAADFAQSLCTLITVMVQQELQKMLANATITTKIV